MAESDEGFRLSLRTRGGFVAGVPGANPPRVVEAADLDEPERRRLDDLLRRVEEQAPAGAAIDDPGAREPWLDDEAGEAEEELGRPKGADVATYVIVVDPPEGESVILTADDVTMPEAFADLLDFIEEHADPLP